MHACLAIIKYRVSYRLKTAEGTYGYQGIWSEDHSIVLKTLSDKMKIKFCDLYANIVNFCCEFWHAEHKNI